MRWHALVGSFAALGLGAFLLLRQEPLRLAQTSRDRPSLVANAEPSRARVATRTIRRAARAVSPSPSLQKQAGDSNVSGYVVDAAGGPVPFAVVTARTLAGAESMAISADADGAFGAQLPAGELELLAHAEAFSSVLRRVEAPAHGVLLELGPSSVVVGRVLDADTRSPLAGVNVSASRDQEQAFDTEPPREPLGSSSTSSAGEFRIDGLRGGGAYRVLLTDANWEGDSRSVLVEVGASSAPVLITARRAAFSSVRILRDGEPCAQGIVRVAGAREWTAPIGAGGVARFVGLRSGHYEVDVFCDEALPQHLELELDGTLTRDIDVSSGLSVSGRVVDAKGRSLAGAKVSVSPRGEPADRPGALCSSDDRGEFHCAGLEPGEHACSVIEPLDAAADVAPIVLDGASARDLVLRVRPLASARVLLTGDEQARAAARVLMRGAPAVPISGKLVDGAFAFERLPLGRYEVYVDQPSAGGGTAVIDLTEDGQLLTLELAAPPRTFISGVVIDASGEPLPDQWVSVSVSDPLARLARETAPQALSDADGTFTLSAVSGGVYDLSIKSSVGTADLYGVTAGSTQVVLRVIAPPPAARAALGIYSE